VANGTLFLEGRVERLDEVDEAKGRPEFNYISVEL
jgi:hypothetical protein